MRDLKEVKKVILKAHSVVIASHINPDGDSIGSLLSLGLGLERLGKRVYMVCQDEVPKRYRRLPSAGRIVRKVDRRLIDLAIAVDCSNKELLGSAFKIFRRAKDILEIDHHEYRRPFGSISLIDEKAAAVGELIYELLTELRIDIDTKIAQNILTSIIVETSSFRLPNVRSFTFKVCAKLTAKSLDFYKLVDMVYWSRTRESVMLSATCLARSKFLSRGRIAWSIIRKSDFRKAGGKDEDVDAVADEMRAMKGVDIAVLFREKTRSDLRVSLRSRKLDIATIAEAYGGGGHFDVAGCAIPNNRKSINGLLELVKKKIG